MRSLGPDNRGTFIGKKDYSEFKSLCDVLHISSDSYKVENKENENDTDEAADKEITDTGGRDEVREEEEDHSNRPESQKDEEAKKEQAVVESPNNENPEPKIQDDQIEIPEESDMDWNADGEQNIDELLGDDDDESDFELGASQSGEKREGETQDPFLEKHVEGEGRNIIQSIPNDSLDFLKESNENDVPESPLKPRKIELKKIRPILPDLEVRIERIKTTDQGNISDEKEKFDDISKGAHVEEEEITTVRRSVRVATRSISRETLSSPDSPPTSPESEKVKQRKRKSENLGGEIDCRETKQPKVQSPSSKDVKKTEEHSCPISGCEELIKSEEKYESVYYLVKHVIQKHLSQGPCKLYDASQIRCGKMRKFKCSYCDKKNDSSSSVFTHMALYHNDLFRRIQVKLKGLTEREKGSKSLISEIDEYLRVKWGHWGECHSKDIEGNQFDEVLLSKANGEVKENIETESKGVKPEDIPKLNSTAKSFEDEITAIGNVSVVKKKEKERRMKNLKRTESKNIKIKSVKKKEGLMVERKMKSLKKKDDLNNTKLLRSLEVEKEAFVENNLPATGELIRVSITCKHCDFLYYNNQDLIKHLREKHHSMFHDIPLLEAGEKFFECTNCSFKSKEKLQLAKHLQKSHRIISLSLIENEDSWKGGELLSFKDFCYITRNEDEFGYAPYRPIPLFNSAKQVSRRRGFLSVSAAVNVEESQSDPRPLDNNLVIKESEKAADDSDPDVIVEEVVRLISRRPSIKEEESRCKVCDLEFDCHTSLSRHVFLKHVQDISNEVWHSLYSNSSEAEQRICSLCQTPLQSELRAKLHLYNNHKKELKKMMDAKKVDWRNLLDFIRYNIPDDEHMQADSDDEISSSVKCPEPEVLVDPIPAEAQQEAQQEAVVNPDLACPYIDCEESFLKKNDLMTHYISAHQSSSLTFVLGEALLPNKFQGHRFNLFTGLSEVTVLRCESCLASFSFESVLSEHSSQHQKPDLLSQCQHCLLFIDKSLAESHASQCRHSQEGNRIKKLRELLDRNILPCTHRRSGCSLTFTNKNKMSSHARDCVKRPATNFECTGCSKKYYYEEDFARHIASHEEMNVH